VGFDHNNKHAYAGDRIVFGIVFGIVFRIVLHIGDSTCGVENAEVPEGGHPPQIRHRRV
jgi:hypothetical protein